MPNRILKDSICRSEEINNLSWFEEAFFYRLIVSCDDYGRFDGRTKIIKGQCFPLSSVTEKEINKALNRLSEVGLVRMYLSSGKPILQLVTWEQHQTIRAKKSKYPECDENCIHLNTIDEAYKHLISNECKCSRNPIQSESESISESESNVCSEQECSEPPVITLPLNDKSEYAVLQSDVLEWQNLYPAVDIEQCLRNMRGWLLSNPKKRKTKRGIHRFITTWLQKEQDKGGTKPYTPSNNTRNMSTDDYMKETTGWWNDE